ncbi:MAG: glycosyltransferase family 2 protein [Shewanella frigidimarina]|nr:glycosyltransferase family 2 protein [Shewanella frigidimarina]
MCTIKFSIIIPTYNNASTLKRAVDSIIAQKYVAHEIIIIDDGSTDETSEVVSKFGSQVIYRRQKNCGVSVARNFGASIASGDWLAFLDADDTYTPNRLKAHADWLSETGLDFDFLLGNQEYISPNQIVLQRSLEGTRAGRALLLHNPNCNRIIINHSHFKELIEDGYGEIRTLSVPRKTFIKLNGFREGMRIGEDLHFLIRLCTISKKAGVVTDILASYYIYNDSTLRKDVLLSQIEFLRALEDLSGELKKSSIFIKSGLNEKIRNVRLSLAYAYLRKDKKIDAIKCLIPPLIKKFTLKGLRDILSVIKGLPANSIK